jgi:hypothetical protein
MRSGGVSERIYALEQGKIPNSGDSGCLTTNSRRREGSLVAPVDSKIPYSPVCRIYTKKTPRILKSGALISKRETRTAGAYAMASRPMGSKVS